MRTHDVVNQVPPLIGRNTFTDDVVLTEAVARWGTPQATEHLTELGHVAGSARAQRLAEDANTLTPRLRTHDRTGVRVDEVEFHPAWHELLDVAVRTGFAGTPWTEPPDGRPHLERAAGFSLWSQVEAGHGCPVSMTYAAVPALRADPDLSEVWEPRLASRAYDPGLRDPATKAGCLAGMGMTEKQGGSDVRANSTTATAHDGGPVEGGVTYRLTGHKWFCSAPTNDVFLVLAQAPGGLTCFVVPRVLTDGTRNDWQIQRLKDKLGNRSNASAEIELDGTWAVRLGEEGQGVRTIVPMVSATRLDCVLGSAAMMRRSVVLAVHHARHRSTFGARLVDQPLMRSVLADLAVESEAATLLGMRLAAAVDRAEVALTRLAVALGKYWVCKRAPAMVGEALECLGGNGYVEENGIARIYREAPVNSVWEGSGNVNALDVLRVLDREPDAVEALIDELDLARGGDHRLDAATTTLRDDLRPGPRRDADARASGARTLVERLATALQASLLVRYSPGAVADAFVSTRCCREGGLTFGTLPAGVAVAPVLARALP